MKRSINPSHGGEEGKNSSRLEPPHKKSSLREEDENSSGSEPPQKKPSPREEEDGNSSGSKLPPKKLSLGEKESELSKESESSQKKPSPREGEKSLLELPQMKPSPREEDENSSRSRPPQNISSSGEEEVKNSSGSELLQKKPSINDVLEYHKNVKDTMFEDKNEVYDEFMNMFEGLEANKIGATGVIEKVNEVFKGNEDYLVSGVNNFMQKECEVKLPLEDERLQEKPLPEFPEVLDFVGKVRTHFEGDDGLFMSFVNILRLYNKKLKSFTNTYHEIVALLIDHKDLLDEFTGFFPSHRFPELYTPSETHADRSSP